MNSELPVARGLLLGPSGFGFSGAKGEPGAYDVFL